MPDTPGVQVHFSHMGECGGDRSCGNPVCRCLCHESERTAAVLRAHQEALDTDAAPVGPPALLVDPEAVQLAMELGQYSAPVVRAGVTAGEAMEGADHMGAWVRLASETGEMAGRLPCGPDDAARYLSISVVVPTFGTADQARATAERVRRMLSVELHQPVVFVGDPSELEGYMVEANAQRQGCSCYDDLGTGTENGPVLDPDCKVHGRRAR